MYLGLFISSMSKCKSHPQPQPAQDHVYVCQCVQGGLCMKTWNLLMWVSHDQRTLHYCCFISGPIIRIQTLFVLDGCQQLPERERASPTYNRVWPQNNLPLPFCYPIRNLCTYTCIVSTIKILKVKFQVIY